METSKLLESIGRLKAHGDATKIHQIANRVLAKKGEEGYSYTAIAMMLTGDRTINDTVAEVTAKYYAAQEKFNQIILAI